MIIIGVNLFSRCNLKKKKIMDAPVAARNPLTTAWAIIARLSSRLGKRFGVVTFVCKSIRGIIGLEVEVIPFLERERETHVICVVHERPFEGIQTSYLLLWRIPFILVWRILDARRSLFRGAAGEDHFWKRRCYNHIIPVLIHTGWQWTRTLTDGRQLFLGSSSLSLLLLFRT